MMCVETESGVRKDGCGGILRRRFVRASVACVLRCVIDEGLAAAVDCLETAVAVVASGRRTVRISIVRVVLCVCRGAVWSAGRRAKLR